MKPKKNTPHSPKCAYHIRNWQEYNQALVHRGSLTVWIEEAVLAGWLATERSGRCGASCTYSDAAIETALMLKAVYHLPLRATQGLLASVLRLLQSTLPVPHYSTLSRRHKTLPVTLRAMDTASDTPARGLHLVVDSTGCKIYGEGEWKVRQHGSSKRRTWRKLHLGVDEATGTILAAVLSTNDVADGAVLPDLIEQLETPIEQLSGDGSYDQRRCYDALATRQAAQGSVLKVTIPPRQGAHIWQHGNCHAPPLARDENVRRIRAVGRAQWKQESGYHRRSLAETAMFRYKSLFGPKLGARGFAAQATEAFIRCAALNKMTSLGMPVSYRVEAP